MAGRETSALGHPILRGWAGGSAHRRGHPPHGIEYADVVDVDATMYKIHHALHLGLVFFSEGKRQLNKKRKRQSFKGTEKKGKCWREADMSIKWEQRWDLVHGHDLMSLAKAISETGGGTRKAGGGWETARRGNQTGAGGSLQKKCCASLKPEVRPQAKGDGGGTRAVSGMPRRPRNNH